MRGALCPGANLAKRTKPAMHLAIYTREIESATGSMVLTTGGFPRHAALARWRIPAVSPVVIR